MKELVSHENNCINIFIDFSLGFQRTSLPVEKMYLKTTLLAVKNDKQRLCQVLVSKDCLLFGSSQQMSLFIEVIFYNNI